NILKLNRLVRQFKQRNVDVVIHAHLTWAFFYVAIATLFVPCTRFYTEHNTSNRRRNIPFFWVVERLFYKRYRKIFCISEGVRDSLAGWLRWDERSKLELVFNGARLYSLVSRPPLTGRLARLVSIGSLTPKKNFGTAIEAVALVKDIVERYVIVGD